MAKRTNGEGTIYQRSNGLWCAELTISYDEDGKRIKKSFSSMDLEKLQKKLNDEKFKLDRNIITQNSNYTVASWIIFWLENYKANTIKAKTYDNYEYAFNCYIKNSIGHYKLNKIRPEAIQQLYNQLGNRKLSTSTIKRVHITLSQAFEQAIKNELIYANPCKATNAPKTETRKARAMTVTEQEAFVKNCTDSTFHNLFIFLLNTGLRCGEALSLTWNDIDFKGKTIKVDKNTSVIVNRDDNAETKTKTIIDTAKTPHSIRSVPINKRAEKVLLEQKTKPENEMFVFSSKARTILMRRNINRALKNLLDTANLPHTITVHTLRHTFATRLLEKGVNPKIVSDILGHASVQITLDIYSHIMPNIKSDAVSLLD